MFLASAVGSDVTSAFRVSVVIASLANLGLAGVLFAEWPSRMKVHSSGKGFLFRYGCLESILLFGRSGGVAAAGGPT